MLKFRLENEGFDVTYCRTSSEIKKAFCNSTPDLIIFNRLPEFSYKEFNDYIGSQKKNQVPTLFIKSLENDLDQIKTNKNNYISAPVSPSELILRVNELLGS
jgi:DNA-binding response OmpR family regulator